ncbi:MAG TPA: pilus (MSHA type) biogenesis protein MshL [Verrucomicrobiae bacterium]|nr:pilus (MSHA type) biogenesis protein MshL [Verrucomicrobiae bacterium]
MTKVKARRTSLPWAIAVAAAALLASCASEPERETRAVPTEVSDALLPPLGYGERTPSTRIDAAQQRFDINVRDVPAQAFFLSLVEGTPYNVVVQPGITGDITLNLKNVTVQEAMDHVREAFGYDYRKTPAGYTILAETMQSRIFRVNYLNVKRSGKSRISVSSGQLTERSGAGSTAAGAASNESGRDTVASSGIETQSDSDFWVQIDSTLRALMPEGGGRKLVINRDAGLIVARAMTSELRSVEEYLRSLQVNLTRQVILEAKILEVQLNESFQAGINWTAVGTTSDGYLGAGGQFGGNGVFDNGANASAGAPITVDPVTGAMVLPVAPTAIGGAITAVLRVNDFNAVIEALQGQGDVRVLSSPRVSTVNNQKAIIKVGSDEFFVTGVQSNATAGTGGTNTTRSVLFTPFFSGIALDVTPQIDEHGTVTLHVHPTVSEVRDDVKELEFGAGQVETFPLALSNVREADSIVRARSGQVIVIGGLMQESNRDDRFGVPLLSRLPLIGFLFRQTRVSERKSELVILLKPVVVESDEQWAEEVRRRQLRVEELRGDQRRWWN